MEEAKDINRIKVVLDEKKRTNKWLAEQLGKDPATVSKWCTNTSQPGLGTLLQIANVLEVNVKELLSSSLDETIQTGRLVKYICENVTHERNKRVINGYTTPKGEEVPELTANTLRYYRTSFVGRNRSMKNMRQLMSLSTDMLCIKEDLYTEQPKFGEQPTYKNVFRYFDNGGKRMMIIYREEAVQQLAELIQKTDYEGKMFVYIFSPGEDPWEGEFEEAQDHVQLCALPQAIYNAYRHILPKKKDELVGADETKVTEQANVTGGMLNFDNEEDLQ